MNDHSEEYKAVDEIIQQEQQDDQDTCPKCGCELDWEVIDDTLYRISGGYDSREFMVRCPQCGYRERRSG